MAQKLWGCAAVPLQLQWVSALVLGELLLSPWCSSAGSYSAPSPPYGICFLEALWVSLRGPAVPCAGCGHVQHGAGLAPLTELQIRARSMGAYSKSKRSSSVISSQKLIKLHIQEKYISILKKKKRKKPTMGWLWLDEAVPGLGKLCWFPLPHVLAPTRLGFQHLPFSAIQKHLWKCAWICTAFFFMMVTQLKELSL